MKIIKSSGEEAIFNKNNIIKESITPVLDVDRNKASIIAATIKNFLLMRKYIIGISI